jgi:hypothetical protein
MRLSGNKLNLAEKPYKPPTNQPLLMTSVSPYYNGKMKEKSEKR